MSLAAGERKKEMVQIECRWVVFQKVGAATENEQELWPRVWCLVFLTHGVSTHATNGNVDVARTGVRQACDLVRGVCSQSVRTRSMCGDE